MEVMLGEVGVDEEVDEEEERLCIGKNIFVDTHYAFLDYGPLIDNDYIVEGIIKPLACLDALVATVLT